MVLSEYSERCDNHFLLNVPLISRPTASDLLRKAIPPLGITDTVTDALRWMEKYKCFTIPIVQSVDVDETKRIPMGVLDCRFLFNQIGAHFAKPAASYRELFRKPLFQVICPRPMTLSLRSSLAEVIQLMIDCRRDLVPIAGDEGWVGVVTLGDILDEFIGRKVICNALFEMSRLKLSLKQLHIKELEESSQTVREGLPLILMPSVRFGWKETLQKAVTVFRKKDTFLIPVYDATERLQGTLSQLDILRGLLKVSEQESDSDCQRVYHTLSVQDLGGDTCGSVSIQATAVEAAEVIRMYSLCGLSVFSGAGSLYGFVTPCSLLSALSSGCLLETSFPA